MSAADIEKLNLDGREIEAARVDGPADVFLSPSFTLVKARWVGDEEVITCCLCNNKFNQLRRKHHCRQCGRVLCSKCCKDKVPLPQLGLHDPERVCEYCKPVTELVTKSYSQMLPFKREAATGLAQCIRDNIAMRKVVELGGLHRLIHLAREEDPQMWSAIASGVHILATYPALHPVLAQAGAIKAICKILTNTDESQLQLLTDAISALMIFCKSPELKTQALQDGALVPVLSTCTVKDDAVALLALSTLSLIVEHPDTHDIVIQNECDALPRILRLTASRDEQIQEVALRTLAHLSMGTDWHRQRLVQEDFSAGHSLVKALNSRPKNVQVLCNAACLVANLATSAQTQGALIDMLESLCNLMKEYPGHAELLQHVARAMANFAHYKQNTGRLIQHLPEIISVCLKSANPGVSQQALRILVQLLSHSPDSTVATLLREGVEEFMRGLVRNKDVVDALNAALLTIAPDRARPM